MTNEKLKSLFGIYRAKMDEKMPNIEPKQMTAWDTVQLADAIPAHDRVAHYKYMCEAGQVFVDEGKIDKAMRWLGFLQGVCWRTELFTLDELKKHATS